MVFYINRASQKNVLSEFPFEKQGTTVHDIPLASSQLPMTRMLLFQKVESNGGMIFKVQRCTVVTPVFFKTLIQKVYFIVFYLYWDTLYIGITAFLLQSCSNSVNSVSGGSSVNSL